MTTEQRQPKPKRKLTEIELLEMAREMNPELGYDFRTKAERELYEFLKGIKLI